VSTLRVPDSRRLHCEADIATDQRPRDDSEYGDRIKFVSGRAKEQLGLSTVLIRPDGFIAWASDNEPDEQSIRQAVALWFGSCATKGGIDVSDGVPRHF